MLTQLLSVVASERTALALVVLNACLLLFVLRRVRRAFLAASSGAAGVLPGGISTKPSVAVTPAERSKYLKLCESLVAEAEAATRADSGIAWVPRGSERDARVFAYTDPKNPVIKIKGVVELDVPDISLLVKHFVSNTTTEKLTHNLGKLDPMLISAVVLGEVAPGGKTSNTQLEWGTFRVPPPLATRDFVWLSHQRLTTDSDGRGMFVSLAHSVARPEAPDTWRTRSVVRGLISNTGYVFKQLDAIRWELTYVVQVDPCGAVPKFVVNLVATDQAGVAANTKEVVEEVQAANAALGGAAARGEAAWALAPIEEVLVDATRRVPLGECGAGTLRWRYWVADASREVRAATDDGAPVDGRSHRDGVREGSAQVRGGSECELVWTRAPARGLASLMSWMGDRPLCVYYQVLKP